VRRNIETTDSGAMHTDAEIRAAARGKRRITEADVKAGRYLANLSKKSMIASLLGNLAGVYLDSPNLKPGPWRFEKARALADESLRLDPGSPLALLCRGRARIELGDDEEAALADLEAALRLDDGSVRTRNVMASLLLRMGRKEEALARFEKSLAVRPESRDARLGVVRCLLALDRTREALDAAEESNRRVPNDREIRWVRLTALIRRRDSRWRHVLEALSDSPSSKPCTVIDCGLYLNVAALLLQREKGHVPDAASALEVLSRIPDHGLEAPKGTEHHINSVLRKAPDGKTNILIRKKRLRTIQRRRDDLRERAKSILESGPTPASGGSHRFPGKQP
jgi:tetratricopeptide (TPR) repeat protein